MLKSLTDKKIEGEPGEAGEASTMQMADILPMPAHGIWNIGGCLELGCGKAGVLERWVVGGGMGCRGLRKGGGFGYRIGSVEGEVGFWKRRERWKRRGGWMGGGSW